MTKLNTFSIVVFVGFLVLVWTNTACDQKDQEQKLAELYCGACHLFPKPDLVDKKGWEMGVLPQMAIRMGVADPDFKELNMEEYQTILEKGGLPLKPMISKKDWSKIVAYYLKNAPEKIEPSQGASPIMLDSQQFKPQILWQSPGENPNFSLVKYFPAQNILVAGQREGKLYLFNGPKQELQDSLFTPSSASDIDITQNGQLQLLLMGKMDPNDAYSGALIEIGKKAGRWKVLRTLVNSLNRPVQFASFDKKEDKGEAFAISEFGHYTGALSWHETSPDGKSKIYQLFNGPGARVAHVVDLDQDGKQDIVALLSQGDEKIIWFKNLGKGVFDPRLLARFLPIYGSSYLEIADMNQDGKLDLIHSAGDNYDYSYALKGYHGIRILLNQGDQYFVEKKFLPMHGAGKVLAEDFDQDGNLDLACTSYFPDYAQKPLGGFVVFRNQGNLKFKAQAFPLGDKANWLLMDKGDVDQDGDCDIILGACSINNTVPKPLRQDWKQHGIGVLLFKNQLK
ncbi:MAG: VCBS repeat-containing protein [Haliscomenobacter sp.]|uniref:FG-GAP repeat domain-containing protein n=1 Tax=Haliscomenobacter sp. TaxID=2717303 RepID=UPI0029AD8EE2|nr:VCBS repeat-containing protein [Haliscomenobacter sp.]MDX2071488.1 VCBS repeat-containing protein [Haliscomenobacter sp.]